MNKGNCLYGLQRLQSKKKNMRLKWTLAFTVLQNMFNLRMNTGYLLARFDTITKSFDVQSINMRF